MRAPAAACASELAYGIFALGGEYGRSCRKEMKGKGEEGKGELKNRGRKVYIKKR